jgi:hypothetical protein
VTVTLYPAPMVTVRCVFDEPFHGVEVLAIHEDHHTSWSVDDAAPGEPCGFSWSGDAGLLVTLGLILAETPEARLAVPRIAAHPTMRAAITRARLEYLRASEIAATCGLAVKGEAPDALTGWFLRAAADLAKCIDVTAPPPTAGPVGPDLALASVADGMGKAGKTLAAKLRESARTADPWGRWQPDASCTLPGLVMLARCGWHDVIKPRLDRERAKPAALPRLVHAPVTQILSGPRVVDSGGQMALELGLPQPCIVREVAGLPSATHNLKLFQSIHAHRVLWHIVFTAHSRAISNPGWSPHLEYEGGYTALAEACGISGGDGAVKVRDLIDLFSVLDLTFPGYRGGLLTRTFIEAKRNRRSLLTIIPGTPLLPGYVHEVQRVTGTTSPTARRDQDLIPLLPVPPTMGRANDAGPQATLQLGVVAYMRDHAVDLAEGRGAPLPIDTWTRLAAESHVPRSLAPDLLPHWLKDHKDGPAVLKLVGRDRYTLGDAHAAARTFLEDGGRRSLDAAEAGRKSTAKRAAARRKAGQK